MSGPAKGKGLALRDALGWLADTSRSRARAHATLAAQTRRETAAWARPADVTIMQTADPIVYSAMLQITSEVTIAHCRRWNVAFECFVGLRRGTAPWHATFNRIDMLQEMIDRGERGWVVYLDADTLFADLAFDLRAYLRDKAAYAAILVPSGATDAWWDVNIGVSLFNLADERARDLIARWRDNFLAIDDDKLEALKDFEIGSQSLFHDALQADEAIRTAILFERPEHWNAQNGTVVKHLLRADLPDLATRQACLSGLAGQVLGTQVLGTEVARRVMYAVGHGEQDFARPADPRVTILQTADTTIYSAMSEVTARSTFAYCRRWNIAFEWFLGRKRGPDAWHASFNRVVMLQDMVDRGDRGWAIYVDADAFIADHDFDLRAYLRGKDAFAAILIRSGATDAWWDINSGVCFFNLAHLRARDIIGRWWSAFMELDDETLGALAEFGMHDQDLLQRLLREDASLASAIFFESQILCNSLHATFVKHLLRADESDLSARVERLSGMVDDVLARHA